jgi:hypothetical protein
LLQPPLFPRITGNNGDRNKNQKLKPNSKTKEDDLLRVQRIIELQRDFLSLTGLQNFEVTESNSEKKGKKK